MERAGNARFTDEKNRQPNTCTNALDINSILTSLNLVFSILFFNNKVL